MSTFIARVTVEEVPDDPKAKIVITTDITIHDKSLNALAARTSEILSETVRLVEAERSHHKGDCGEEDAFAMTCTLPKGHAGQHASAEDKSLYEYASECGAEWPHDDFDSLNSTSHCTLPMGHAGVHASAE